jgi:hypothetical protein
MLNTSEESCAKELESADAARAGDRWRAEPMMSTIAPEPG